MFICSKCCIFALGYQPEFMIQEDIVEYDILEEVLSSEWIVSEPPTRDLDTLLDDLHTLHGSAFVTQLKYIAAHRAFTPINDETGIYSVGGEQDADLENLLNAARKAVEHGYRVFILPNPKGIRTADFIFERKGVFKMFDLKTIMGKSSAVNRLLESIGQTYHVLLNMATDYDPRLLAKDVRTYFEVNKDAREVLIMKGNKCLSISRQFVEGKDYVKMFMKRYLK